MLVQAIQFLLDTLLGLVTLAFLLRFYLQLMGAPFHNPFSQAIVAFTNFAVRPLRRVVPSLRMLDTSTLLSAFLAQLLLHFATLWLHEFPILVADGQIYAALIGLALLGLAKSSIFIFLYAVVIQAILSWINPQTPLAPALNSLTSPMLRPLRKLIPSGGGIDFSPLVVFIIAELALMLIIAPVEHYLLRMF